ncbi:hypothetical protein GCM10025778_10910 [Paeniglutamicibacter antarcticus]|uniref:Uncharacterized protein n=1 Tax=Paeniglutamicibacter antarcticus TaxID=494023 RepID=A0ABP9TLC5_9MICC
MPSALAAAGMATECSAGSTPCIPPTNAMQIMAAMTGLRERSAFDGQSCAAGVWMGAGTTAGALLRWVREMVLNVAPGAGIKDADAAGRVECRTSP